MNDFVVTPAYGRDYTTEAAALAAWEAGKDFQRQPHGYYLSSRDTLPAGARVKIRYNKRTEFVYVPRK